MAVSSAEDWVIELLSHYFHSLLITHYSAAKTGELPMIKVVRTLRDSQYPISLSAALPGAETW